MRDPAHNCYKLLSLSEIEMQSCLVSGDYSGEFKVDHSKRPPTQVHEKAITAHGHLMYSLYILLG